MEFPQFALPLQAEISSFPMKKIYETLQYAGIILLSFLSAFWLLLTGKRKN